MRATFLRVTHVLSLYVYIQIYVYYVYIYTYINYTLFAVAYCQDLPVFECACVCAHVRTMSWRTIPARKGSFCYVRTSYENPRYFDNSRAREHAVRTLSPLSAAPLCECALICSTNICTASCDNMPPCVRAHFWQWFWWILNVFAVWSHEHACADISHQFESRVARVYFPNSVV